MSVYCRYQMNHEYAPVSEDNFLWVGFVGRLNKEHPEYRIPGSTHLDFKHREVREFKLSIIEEIARKGVDAVMLDFTVYPPHTEVPDSRIMTGFIWFALGFVSTDPMPSDRKGGVKRYEKPKTRGMFFAQAHLFHRAGVDAIELVDGSGLAWSDRRWYDQLADPETVRLADKHYTVDPKPHIPVRFAPPNARPFEDMTLDRFIDHIDHICSLVGVAHVGIGSDWDGFQTIPGHFMSDISDLPVLTAGLAERGYSEIDIRKILGENRFRVCNEVTSGRQRSVS